MFRKVFPYFSCLKVLIQNKNTLESHALQKKWSSHGRTTDDGLAKAM